MKRAAFISVLGCGLGLMAGLVTGVADAEDALRCGTRLASTGNTKYQVRQVCGEPADISIVGAMRQPQLWFTGSRTYYLDPPYIDMAVEVWTYNFGPNKFLRRLRFEGEELVDIQSDGYGY